MIPLFRSPASLSIFVHSKADSARSVFQPIGGIDMRLHLAVLINVVISMPCSGCHDRMSIHRRSARIRDLDTTIDDPMNGRCRSLSLNLSRLTMLTGPLSLSRSRLLRRSSVCVILFSKIILNSLCAMFELIRGQTSFPD